MASDYSIIERKKGLLMVIVSVDYVSIIWVA